jgi:hypothetical protein
MATIAEQVLNQGLQAEGEALTPAPETPDEFKRAVRYADGSVIADGVAYTQEDWDDEGPRDCQA